MKWFPRRAAIEESIRGLEQAGFKCRTFFSSRLEDIPGFLCRQAGADGRIGIIELFPAFSRGGLALRLQGHSSSGWSRRKSVSQLGLLLLVVWFGDF